MSGRSRSGTASSRYPVAGCPAISTPSSRNCCTRRQTSERLVPISSAILVPLTTTMELSARRRTMCPSRASVRDPGSSSVRRCSGPAWLRGFMRAGENYPARRVPRQAKLLLLLGGLEVDLDLHFLADGRARGIVIYVIIQPVDRQAGLDAELLLSTDIGLGQRKRQLYRLRHILDRQVSNRDIVVATALHSGALKLDV